MKPMIRINDGIEVIDREMTDGEFAAYTKQTEEVEAAMQFAEAAQLKAAVDKAALLAKLGITAEEAKLLLS